MRARTCTCVYICTCVCAYVCACVCVHTRVCCSRLCFFACASVCVLNCTHPNTHKSHKHIRTSTSTHALIHKCTHKDTDADTDVHRPRHRKPTHKRAHTHAHTPTQTHTHKLQHSHICTCTLSFMSGYEHAPVHILFSSGFNCALLTTIALSFIKRLIPFVMCVYEREHLSCAGCIALSVLTCAHMHHVGAFTHA